MNALKFIVEDVLLSVQSFINKRYGIIIFALMLVAIPVTVYVSRMQQDIRQSAGPLAGPGISNGGYDSCNKVKVTIEQIKPNSTGSVNDPDDPRCPTLATVDQSSGQIVPKSGTPKNPFNQISYNVRIETNDGQPHDVEYSISTFFCRDPYGQVGGDGENKYIICNQNSKNYPEDGKNSVVGQVAPNAPIQLLVTRDSMTGTACGSYQFDLAIYKVDGSNECNLQDIKNGVPVGPGVAQICHTGETCVDPTATPTPPPPTPTNALCPAPEKAKNIQVTCPTCSG